MHKKKVLFLGDPFYSSLAHVARVTGIFKHLKRINEIDAHTRMFSPGDLSGNELQKINRKSIENGWLDEIVVIKTDINEYMDFNRAADLLVYFRSSMDMIVAEYRQKIAYINSVHAQFDKIIIFTSPGTFGALITSPVVPEKVHNILILDTFYYPLSEIFIGTGWLKNSLLGKLQAMFFVPRYALPFISELNKLRSKLGVSTVSSRTLFNTTIIDPNVSAYTKITHPVQDYYQIGPLYINQEEDPSLDKKIKEFKGSNALIYITLGGSVSQNEFIGWIDSLLAHLRSELGDNIRYVITTGKSIDPEKVKKRLGDNKNEYWVDSYVNIQQLASHLNLMIGTFGQGQLLMAAKNKCPVIVCPINADQATHAALAVKRNIGERPYRIRLMHLRESKKLIKKALNSEKSIAVTAAKILKDVSRYQNEELAQQLQNSTENEQFEIISRIVRRIYAP